MEDNTTVSPEIQSLDNATARLFDFLMVPACLALVANVILFVVTFVRSSPKTRSPLVRCLALADGLCAFSFMFGYTMTAIILPIWSVVSTFMAIAVLHGIARMAHSWSMFTLVLDRYLSLWNDGKYEGKCPSSRHWILCVAVWIPCGAMGIITGVSLNVELPISVSILRDILRTIPMLCISVFYILSYIILKPKSNESSVEFRLLERRRLLQDMIKTRNIILYFSVIGWMEGLCLIGSVVLYSLDTDAACDTSYSCSYTVERYYYIAEAVSLTILVLAILLNPIVIMLIHKGDWFHNNTNQMKNKIRFDQQTQSLVQLET